MKGLGSETLGHFTLACDGVRQGLGEMGLNHLAGAGLWHFSWVDQRRHWGLLKAGVCHDQTDVMETEWEVAEGSR